MSLGDRVKPETIEEVRERLRRAERERDEARACARTLAHAYERDRRPAAAPVALALSYPVVP